MSISLSMIVKNEAHIIRRCLQSVKPLIDSYSISDTGSTDDTMNIIREEMEGIPGVLTSDPWVDFATNRNLSLSRAIGNWVLVVDADEVLESSGTSPLLPMLFDGFLVRIGLPNGEIWFPRLLRNDPRWKWQFKVHEEPMFDGQPVIGKMEGITLRGFFDSHQNVTASKYANYLAILENEPPTPKNLYNLANTLSVLGRYEEVIAKCNELVKFGENDAITYTALWLAADSMKKLKRSFDEITGAYLRAYNFRPTRYEALVALCELLRMKHRFAESYDLSQVDPIPTTDITLADPRALWRILEEHAFAAFFLGQKHEAKKYFERVLTHDLSADERERILKNLTMCNS